MGLRQPAVWRAQAGAQAGVATVVTTATAATAATAAAARGRGGAGGGLGDAQAHPGYVGVLGDGGEERTAAQWCSEAADRGGKERRRA